MMTNCAEGTLAAYVPSDSMPWNSQRVAHLIRRTGFGANHTLRAAALSADPQDLIDELVDAALNAPLSTPPEWGYWTFQDYGSIEEFVAQSQEQHIEWLTTWFTDFQENPLRGKMTLFWSNHFVTESAAYDCPSYLYQYHRVLQEHALGNLKDFVHAVGLTPAMLVYLNGLENGKEEPNENYARELYELFTLGADNNYTQTDIEETARALTGYTFFQNYCGEISFDPNNHDTAQKTIFGQTGNWGYDDVIDILFEQRAAEIAYFISEKLYTFFVHPEPAPEIIEGLAQTFLDNNWEIEPVLRQLFKSEHFFDLEVMNTVIRSPFDILLGLANEMDYEIPENLKFEFLEFAAYLGQYLSSPVNVAGWPGNRTWISTNLLTARWQANSYLVFSTFQNSPDKLQDLAVNLVGSTSVSDPDLVSQLIVDFMIPGGLTDPAQYDRAAVAFRAEVPDFYYDTGQWNLAWDTIPGQVALLIDYIGKMPETQLM